MNAKDIVEAGRSRGLDIDQADGCVVWQGDAAGCKKPAGPLRGTRVALVVAPEFSDFQAYYLAVYLSEYGADVEFVGVEGALWKYTRPNDPEKGLQGMWGMSLNPIPVLGDTRSSYVTIGEAQPGSYDAVIVLGGHSADVLTTSPEALSFLDGAAKAGCMLGAIGEGTLPIITQELIGGRRCTGNHVVSYMLERVGEYTDCPVVRHEGLVTCRDTEYCAEFVRELARHFDPDFRDQEKGSINGRRVVIVAGEDFEDIELVVPVLELLHRGAVVTLATFPPPMRSRPPLIGLDVVMGNFGVSVPLQDVPDDRYEVRLLSSIEPHELDMAVIPGAFCPWNLVAARTPLEWLKQVHGAGRRIAAICHGPIPLSASDLVAGKRVAGVDACRAHVTTMGGEFLPDASAAVDGEIVTGRVPPDIPEFIDAMTYALL